MLLLLRTESIRVNLNPELDTVYHDFVSLNLPATGPRLHLLVEILDDDGDAGVTII